MANGSRNFGGPRSRRLDNFLIQNHAHLAPEQFEQDGHALAIAHAFIDAKTITKRAPENSDLVAWRETRLTLKLNPSVDILTSFQAINDGQRHQSRLVTVTYQSCNSES